MNLTAEIDKEALLIADVVLNAVPHKLQRPQRALAIDAMNALGYSTAHMIEALGVANANVVANLARRCGVPMRTRREWVDRRAVQFICQGFPLHVTSNTFDAAVIALSERGDLSAHAAAKLLLNKHGQPCSREYITDAARRLGVRFFDPPAWMQQRGEQEQQD